MIHKPQTVIPLSWAEIVNHYTDLIAHGWKLSPMLLLVNHIIETNLDERLFAFVSLDRLFIGIHNPLDRDSEVLHISFNREEQIWLFEYRPKPFVPAEFVRQYSVEKGIEKFDNLVKLLKW